MKHRLMSSWIPDRSPGTLPSVISNWRDAEDVAAAWLRRFGYPDADVNRGMSASGADFGVDVESAGAAAQVKWRSKASGISDVQRLIGSARRGQTCVFFSRAGYTSAAYMWAFERPVALFVMRDDGTIAAANRSAARVLDRTPERSLTDDRDIAGLCSVILVCATIVIMADLAMITALPGAWQRHPGDPELAVFTGFVAMSLAMFTKIMVRWARHARYTYKRGKRSGLRAGWRSYFSRFNVTQADESPMKLFEGYSSPMIIRVVRRCKDFEYYLRATFQRLGAQRRRRGTFRDVY